MKLMEIILNLTNNFFINNIYNVQFIEKSTFSESKI